MTTFLLGACATGLIFALYLTYDARNRADTLRRELAKERRAKDRDSKVAKELVTDTAEMVAGAMEKVTVSVGQAIKSSLGFDQPAVPINELAQQIYEQEEEKQPTQFPDIENDPFFVDPNVPAGEGEWGPPSTDGNLMPSPDLEMR